MELDKLFCFICGSEEGLTKHHFEPSEMRKGDGKGYIIVCRTHHDVIEDIKMAIKIVDREKRVMSMRQMRKIVDSVRKLK